MRRCSKCVMPDSRPDIRFDEQGVCSACRAYERRPTVDWNARADQFAALMKQHRGVHPAYDCLVASSGGKDSHFITIKVLELGYKPLVMTATTDMPTDIGRRNIENLKSLGVDYLEFTPNPIVRRKLMHIGLEMVGDIEWPEHCAIFSQPVRVAQEMGIGVVLYGENPQAEYSGGPQDAVVLDRRWRDEFGGLLGLRPKDLIGIESLTAADLWPYEWPSEAAVAPRALFLGQFFEWHGWKNALIASVYGFESLPTLVEGNLVSYENLDNAVVGLHDWFAFLKYGFSRATVMASLYIRRGMLTRDEAIRLVSQIEGQPPRSYIGVPTGRILPEIGMTPEQYIAIEEKYANPNVVLKDERGYWKLKEPIA